MCDGPEDPPARMIVPLGAGLALSTGLFIKFPPVGEFSFVDLDVQLFNP